MTWFVSDEEMAFENGEQIGRLWVVSGEDVVYL